MLPLAGREGCGAPRGPQGWAEVVEMAKKWGVAVRKGIQGERGAAGEAKSHAPYLHPTSTSEKVVLESGDTWIAQPPPNNL